MAGMQSNPGDVDVDIGQLFGSIGRRWMRLLAGALVLMALALAFSWLVTPKYKAETRILIETRESELTRLDRDGNRSGPILDEEGVTSQVEVIGSSDILTKVAKQLDLASRKEFDESLVDRVMVLLGLKADTSALPREERVLTKFREKLDVYRVERSRVIVIEFSSIDPKLAADVPNAMADAYLTVQQAAKLQSNADATQWLAPEINDLREKVKQAEAKVASFRGTADLLVGQNSSVLATQQLSELSSELSRVRASRSAAEGKAQAVRAAIRGGASLDALPDVQSSGLIQRLREREVQLRSDIADLSTTLLANHPRVRSLNSQLADLETQIRAEGQKILAGVETEVATAKAREGSLIAEVNQLKAASTRADGESVELRALEREAAAQRELLESYLARYREATSRADRNYLPVDARIFSRATIPAEPYFPKVLPIAGAAFAAGLLVMVIVTLLQELFSGRAMRPATRVRIDEVDEVEMPVAVGPVEPETRTEPRMRPAPEPVAAPAEMPVIAAAAPLVREPAAMPAAFAEPAPAAVLPAAPIPSVRPMSLADAVATIRPPARPVEVALAPVEKPRVARIDIGAIDVAHAAERLISGGATRAVFVSPEGDEGAAASVLVAREIADAGLRVIMLDLTRSGAASAPMLEHANMPGITNLLVSEAQFSDVVHGDLYSEASIIPVGTADAGRAMRAAERLPIILQALASGYDIVIIECGATNASGIRRLVGEATEIVISAIEPTEAMAQAAREIARDGLGQPMIVTPGHLPPFSPDRSVA